MSIPPPPEGAPPPAWPPSVPTGVPSAPPPTGQPVQWPPAPPPGAAPFTYAAAPAAPAAPKPPGSSVLEHWKRANAWRLDRVRPSEAELHRLTAAGVSEPLVQGYASWRKSAMTFALPVVLISAVLAVVGFKDVDTSEVFNQLGVISQVLPLLGPITLALGLVVALLSWDKPARSRKALMYGWLASVVLPLLPALFSLDWLINRDVLLAQLQDQQLLNAQLITAKVSLGVHYMIALLPTVVTFPGGVVKGSVRAKGLLPDSSLPGFFLVTTAPFYSLIVLVSLVLVVQFVGTGLLLLGTLLLALSPWVYVIRRRHYVGVLLDDEESKGIDRAQRLNGLLGMAGLAAIVLWALTAEVDGVKVMATDDTGLLDTVGVARAAVEAIARSFATTVVFSQIFLMLALTAWRSSQRVRNDPRLLQADARNEALAAALGHTA